MRVTDPRVTDPRVTDPRVTDPRVTAPRVGLKTLTAPRLSLHMMVRDGADVVERALRPLGGIADEVVFVDTGSTDGTPDAIEAIALDMGMACRAILMSPDTHPDDYFLDDQSSFKTKIPATNFSGSWIPRDWSLIRNRSLDACSGEYVMKLDADDEVMIPENIVTTLAYLDARPDIDIVMSTYEVMTRAPSAGIPPAVEHTSMYTRLWRRSPRIRFAEVCHENVDHARNPDGSNWLMVPSGLLVRDWRDSAGVRPAHRNLKVLLLEYEQLTALGARGSQTRGSQTRGSQTRGSQTRGSQTRGSQTRGSQTRGSQTRGSQTRGSQTRPGKHLLMYLADEAATVLPDLSLDVLGQVQDLTPADEAWAGLIRGQALVRLGNLLAAAREYEAAASLGSHRAALLLGMIELGMTGSEERLASAIPVCQQKMWPVGASNLEVIAARQLLDHHLKAKIGRVS